MDGLTHLMKIKSRIRRHQLRNGAVGKGGTPSPCTLSIEPDGKPVSIILLTPSARQRSVCLVEHPADVFRHHRTRAERQRAGVRHYQHRDAGAQVTDRPAGLSRYGTGQYHHAQCGQIRQNVLKSDAAAGTDDCSNLRLNK
ncbi:hypothetical protein HA51_02515 [Pantoea rwandensis]|uniref:Uncharacterized protein n=1 Tax=Pantoea rwandensis TaxID=1076550 RepID=A0A1X1D5H9_9GAMM|nr:hypothetical protein HA51_02515 [Pantoea rwandensis]